MMSQKDAVGLFTFTNTVTQAYYPKSYRSYLAKLFEALLETQAQDVTDVQPVLHSMAEAIKKRSLIVMISDLLDDPERILSGLKHFRNRQHEVIVFHITDPQEEQFKFRGETEFVDSETGEKITVTPWQIRGSYLDAYNSYVQTLKEGCHQVQIEYNPVTTATPFNDLLVKYLIKRRKG